MSTENATPLEQRVAEALGWSIADVRSTSLQSRRELLRVSHPKLAAELTQLIQNLGKSYGAPLRRRRR